MGVPAGPLRQEPQATSEIISSTAEKETSEVLRGTGNLGSSQDRKPRTPCLVQRATIPEPGLELWKGAHMTPTVTCQPEPPLDVDTLEACTEGRATSQEEAACH